MDKRKVIIVTDGDTVAQRAVELAAHNIGARTISATAGNPTVLTGSEIVEMIKLAEHDPVVVMVDDQGDKGVGSGEMAMKTVLKDESLDILGIIAVSSNGKDCKGIAVNFSITQDGKIISNSVDKYGMDTGTHRICGDTLSVLSNEKDRLIIGIGDPGKMDFKDDLSNGAPITTMALQEVLKRSGKFIN